MGVFDNLAGMMGGQGEERACGDQTEGQGAQGQGSMNIVGSLLGIGVGQFLQQLSQHLPAAVSQAAGASQG